MNLRMNSLSASAVTPTCSKHPERETFRSCTRCSEPYCADCLADAAVGAHCVVCRSGDQVQQSRLNRSLQPTVKQLSNQVRPSLVFVAVAAAFLGSCIWAWTAQDNLEDPSSRWAIRVMVMTGWMLSLCFHEFGHAAVAFLGGDRTVVGKGYLTLDPRKYTDGVRSVVIPLVFLLIGGFGLPGGAVYIQTNLIRSERWQSLMSLAGPAANLLFGSLCATPFLFVGFPASHLVFFSALAFLAALQMFAAILNLLPIPGLDGFGALRPYLSQTAQIQARQIGQYSTFVLFMVMFRVPGVSEFLWSSADGLAGLFGMPPVLADAGRAFFSFS
jgi:Zn-dependent protease